MNKQLIGLGVALLMIAGAVNTNAALIVYDDDVVYDNVANKYWFRDLSLFPDKTYTEQMAQINGYPFTHDYRAGWRMADSAEYSSLLTNGALSIKDLFTPTRVQVNQNNTAQYIKYYRGRLHDEVNDGWNTVVGFFFKNYYPNTPTGISYYDPFEIPESLARIHYGAWVVADALHDTLEPIWIEQHANPTPTPEPATMLLFGTGLASLIGFKLRKKR